MDYMRQGERSEFEFWVSVQRLLRTVAAPLWTFAVVAGLIGAFVGFGPGFLWTVIYAAGSMLILAAFLALAQRRMGSIGMRAIHREAEETGVTVNDLLDLYEV